MPSGPRNATAWNLEYLRTHRQNEPYDVDTLVYAWCEEHVGKPETGSGVEGFVEFTEEVAECKQSVDYDRFRRTLDELAADGHVRVAEDDDGTKLYRAVSDPTGE